jgi:hypothetical protein
VSVKHLPRCVTDFEYRLDPQGSATQRFHLLTGQVEGRSREQAFVLLQAAGGRLTVHDARAHVHRLFTIAGLADYLADDAGN